MGEGDSYEDALAEVKSAIRFHVETFGTEALLVDSPILEAFIAEATIPAGWPSFPLMPPKQA